MCRSLLAHESAVVRITAQALSGVAFPNVELGLLLRSKMAQDALLDHDKNHSVALGSYLMLYMLAKAGL